MSDREAHRLSQLSDGHLADKAAYGDAAAFAALADRFHDTVWTVAALASADEDTAVRATARAFTRTLAGVAAGIGEIDHGVERTLVTAAYELATATRVDDARLGTDLPEALLDLAPAARVALWLEEQQGWRPAQAEAVVAGGPESLDADALAAAPTAARRAAADLTIASPAGLATATATAWHEWQGIGLVIPDRHPLTTALARLDAPLGRVGDALGRVGAKATSRRRARPAAGATPPPAVLLPVGADVEVEPEPEADDVDLEVVPVAAARDAAPAEPSDAPVAGTGVLDGPRSDGTDLFGRPRSARELVAAGSTPTRTRILAALAAGILTAAAMGSLLTTAPTTTPVSDRSDQVAAGAPEAGEDGELLDGDDAVPAADADDTEADAPGTTPTTVAATPAPGAGTPPPAAGGAPSGDGSSGPTASSGGGGAPAASGGSGGGGGGPAPTTPTPAPTTPAPTPTTPAPPATTAPPTTAPPTTTPPTTAPPGPVCTLLPILCPGGGLLP